MTEHAPEEIEADTATSERKRSALAPRARAGFTSRDDGVPTETYVAFIAAAVRAGVGALFVFMATLWLPVHMMTPILTGMGILMIANGLLATWRLGRESRGLRAASRVFLYGIPVLVVVNFVILSVLGPSSLGPDWSARRAEKAAEIDAPP
jgi:hypothetical protein